MELNPFRRTGCVHSMTQGRGGVANFALPFYLPRQPVCLLRLQHNVLHYRGSIPCFCFRYLSDHLSPLLPSSKCSQRTSARKRSLADPWMCLLLATRLQILPSPKQSQIRGYIHHLRRWTTLPCHLRSSSWSPKLLSQPQLWLQRFL